MAVQLRPVTAPIVDNSGTDTTLSADSTVDCL